MIVRKQNIKKSSEEVSMMVSYGVPDIKKTMQHYYALFAEKCGSTFALNTPHTELDLLHYFNHYTFAHFVVKYREQLSAWAFAMALRHKFIYPSEDETESKKNYFLSETLKTRIGRPRTTDEDE